VIGALGRTRHRYIVSMGPLHAELELADNMMTTAPAARDSFRPA
jgi:hypothetical protein